jgi:dihydrolipoamide dehydrogenase
MATVHILDCLEKARDFGIEIERKSIDFPAIIARKQNILKQFRDGIKNLLKSYDIEVIKGECFFVSPYKVQVGNKTFKFKKCIIASGSLPSTLPGINIDGKNIITSEHALDLQHPPSSLVIVGGGAIGLEFAQIFNAFGTKVTILEQLPYLVATEDVDISNVLEMVFFSNGIEVRCGVRIKEIKYKDKAVEVVFTSEKGLEKKIFEKALIATGRKPCIKEFGLEDIGLSFNHGKIIVNDKMQTNIKGIYAIGDVIGPPFLAHKACAEAMVAAENVMGKKATIDYKVLPHTIFTKPEVASVGLSERQAKQMGYEVNVGKFPLGASGKAMAMGETKGFIKVVADKKTNLIIGFHLLSPQATELISGAALAIKLGCTTKELNRILYPHPTLSEAIFQAVLATHKESTDLPKFKRS